LMKRRAMWRARLRAPAFCWSCFAGVQTLTGRPASGHATAGLMKRRAMWRARLRAPAFCWFCFAGVQTLAGRPASGHATACALDLLLNCQIFTPMISVRQISDK